MKKYSIVHKEHGFKFGFSGGRQHWSKYPTQVLKYIANPEKYDVICETYELVSTEIVTRNNN